MVWTDEHNVAVDFNAHTITVRVGHRRLTEAYEQEYCHSCEGKGRRGDCSPGIELWQNICLACDGRGWNPVCISDGYIAKAVIAESQRLSAAAS